MEKIKAKKKERVERKKGKSGEKKQEAKKREKWRGKRDDQNNYGIRETLRIFY